jgi:hypothetical protein
VIGFLTIKEVCGYGKLGLGCISASIGWKITIFIFKEMVGSE